MMPHLNVVIVFALCLWAGIAVAWFVALIAPWQGVAHHVVIAALVIAVLLFGAIEAGAAPPPPKPDTIIVPCGNNCECNIWNLWCSIL